MIAGLVSIMTAGYGCQTKELISEDNLLVDRGNIYYASERYTQATDKYRKLVEQYPDSPFRKQGIIALADSLYKDKSYFEAVLYYERFVELYPLDTLTPRAQFYLAMSYYHDTSTAERDQTNSSKAVEIFGQFLNNYPDHILAPAALERKNKMISLIASNQMHIARYYRRVNRNQAAIQRLTEFLAKYPGSDEQPEALYLLGESYYAEQAYKKAAKVFTRIVRDHPQSEYAKKAAEIAKTLKIKM